MTLASHARSSFALLAVFALAACGGSQPEAQPQTQSFASEVPAPTTPAPIPSDTSAAPVPSAMPQSTMGDAKGNSGNSGVAAQETLTDAQIAMIVTTADKGEIDQAKLAQKNAKDAKVKQF
ncbi:MAG TPA: hypothetical protein VHB21_09970, partial [Minicystis sp.]|nr:hypothetical protein [Minicystis sp.]